MPIYEYVCPDCKTKFEILRPISKSSDPADCPECKHTAQRIISRVTCFARNNFDMTAPIGGGGGGGGGCAGCAGGNCTTCHS